MRNIRQYPITREEVCEVLQKIPMDNPPGTPPGQMKIGGLNDLIRQGIIITCTEEAVMSRILKHTNLENDE